MMSDELKPCPNPHCLNTIFGTGDGIERLSTGRVICNKCRTSMSISAWQDIPRATIPPEALAIPSGYILVEYRCPRKGEYYMDHEVVGKVEGPASIDHHSRMKLIVKPKAPAWEVGDGFELSGKLYMIVGDGFAQHKFRTVLPKSWCTTGAFADSIEGLVEDYEKDIEGSLTRIQNAELLKLVADRAGGE